MKRLQVFSYVYYPEEFLINELTTYLSKNWQVDVITSLPEYSKKNEKRPFNDHHGQVNIFRYPVIPRGKGFLQLAINYISNVLGATFRVITLLQKKPDCCFVFATSPITTAIPAIISAKIHKVPIVMWLQDLWPESVSAVGAMKPSSLKYRLIGKVVKFVYKHIDLIMIQSESFQDNLKQYRFQGRSVFVPNWAPNPIKNNAHPAWINEIPEDKFVITFAGNIGKAQNLDTLLNIAREFEDKGVFIAIVGDGSEFLTLKNKYTESLNIKFYGRKPMGDMSVLFERSDALYVSLKDEPIFSKTIPSKMQAYMTAGRPLLCSLNGVGAKLCLDHQIGFVALPNDENQLKKAIKDLLSLDDCERSLMGERAYALYLDKFQADKIMNQIDKILLEQLNS